MLLCLSLPTSSSDSVSSLTLLLHPSNSSSKSQYSKNFRFRRNTSAYTNTRQSQSDYIRFIGCKSMQNTCRRYLELSFPEKSIRVSSSPSRIRGIVSCSRFTEKIATLLEGVVLLPGHPRKSIEGNGPAVKQGFGEHSGVETTLPSWKNNSAGVCEGGGLLDVQKSPETLVAFASNSSAVEWKHFSRASRGAASTRVLSFAGFALAALLALSLIRIAVEKVNEKVKHAGRLDIFRRRSSRENSEITSARRQFQATSGFSHFVEGGSVRRKESVEWVNMILGKLWKVYRRGIESWLVGLLQPLIDNLNKPGYVKRVKIERFYVGDEPLSVRSVERRTSRRAHDLQYHIGLRYTGEARMLLSIILKVGILALSIPMGVRGLDVDGEIWVKLRLVPSEPWVGTATWAFVSLPKIKMALTPFGLFNLLAIPFLSTFLTKLLTEDLPHLFVRPNKIVVDFMQGKTLGPTLEDFKDGASLERNKDFFGELSITVVDARKLKHIPIGKTDPYVVLMLGDQVIRSKKNSQTSIFGPPGAPIWNQDFQLLVVDPKSQHLVVRVRDTLGLTTFTIGRGEVDLSTLQDTVPVDKIVTLKGGWGPFQEQYVGDIVLRLTYKAYVEDEEDERDLDGPLPRQSSDLSDVKTDLNPLSHEKASTNAESDEEVSRSKSFPADLMATISIAANDQGATNQFPAYPELLDKFEPEAMSKQTENLNDEASRKALSKEQKNNKNTNLFFSKLPAWGKSPGVAWLCLATGVAVLVTLNLDFSNFMNP